MQASCRLPIIHQSSRVLPRMSTEPGNPLLVSSRNIHVHPTTSTIPNDIFSDENKQRTIENLSNQKTIFPGEKWIGENFKKRAAVLVPLCYNELHQPSILLTLRSYTMGSHRGEISFPGGKVDEADNEDVVKTALRETYEEVGIPPKDISVWSVLPVVPTVTSLMRVSPVLGLINHPINASSLSISPDEVEVAFTVPIEHLCNSANWDVFKYLSKKAEITMPVFTNLENYIGALNGNVKLWGLTALVTHIALLNLVPQHYDRRSLWGSKL